MKYKWIRVSPGHCKLVESTDPRPEVKLKSRTLPNASSIYTKFTPDWKRYEEAMHKGTPDQQAEAADKFTAERDHALKVDVSARHWEEGRKESWAKDKPQWRKEMMKKGEI